MAYLFVLLPVNWSIGLQTSIEPSRYTLEGVLTLEAIFNLLNSELEDGYGHSIDWQEIIDPSGKPIDLLQKYLIEAIHGDGPDGELIGV